MRRAACSSAPSTIRGQVVSACWTVRTTVVPPAEYRAGNNSVRVSGAGSSVRVVMCFHGPRFGDGLPDAAGFRDDGVPEAVARPLTKYR